MTKECKQLVTESGLGERECFANIEILKNCLRLTTGKTLIFEEKKKSNLSSSPVEAIVDDYNVGAASSENISRWNTTSVRQDVSEVTTNQDFENYEEVSEQWDNSALERQRRREKEIGQLFRTDNPSTHLKNKILLKYVKSNSDFEIGMIINQLTFHTEDSLMYIESRWMVKK